ncbi:MAG: Stk1 family PASTA domain-containing Ser/Thr kinase [Peptococcaceae bacterium]|nr:Stk1 family PASTA domain-containing Ser/Thr kinase [Peptococcaceae bacterium]
MSKTFGDGRYQVLDKLGAGGMAIVYKAQDTVLHRIVTVKVLREQFASDDDFTRRFRREAQAVASLSHPNIVSIYDVGKEADMEYIVMEFVDGQNLKEYIKQHAPLTMPEAVEIAKQICDALEHAHKHQIIHRDIKPHNILLTADGRVKVTDFGIARAASAATVTHTGTIVGSVHYFSPEQARGEVTNEQSDLYSLGIILYEMVTGVLPYDGESPISIALKHMNEVPTPPAAVNPAVSQNLQQVILRAIAKYPEERYSNALEFKQDLMRVAQGLSASPFKPSQRQSLAGEQTQVMRSMSDAKMKDGRKTKRRLRPIAWVALIFVSLLLLGGGTYAAVNKIVNVPETTMPNLLNLTLSDASAKLKLNGLSITADNVHEAYSDTVPDGQIVSQNPSAGAVIKVTRTDLSVVVSQGAQKATFPDVTSTPTDKDAAQAMIAKQGFTTAATITYVQSDTVPANIVISQNPAPNTLYPINSVSSLVVSQGPNNQTVPMPDVVGLQQDAAIQQMEQQRLNVISTSSKPSTNYPQGYVIDSTPKPNADVVQGSDVKLVISEGPGPVARLIPAKEITDILVANVPNDGKPHEVVIKLHDYRGWIQVDQFAYQPGLPYTQDIQYFPTATLQILVDGQMVFTNDYTS